MEILENFGFDPVMLVAQILNFLIIFYLLKRFLYKPVLDMLKKREDTIQKGLEQAEEARITLEKTLEQEKKILIRARDEAKKITENARKQALETAAEVNKNTKKQTEKLITEAKIQIEQDASAVERKLSEKISILASDMLKKSLEGFFGEKEQKQIIKKTLKDIEK